MVAMLAPGDRRAIIRRSADRATWARSAGKDAKALEEEIHHELVLTVVALFDCRHICPIELLYTEDTAVYRYEMFDDSIYISWYHSPRSAGREMPESFSFSSESFNYQSLRLDLIRKFEISEKQVKFNAHQDDAYLQSHLSSLLGVAVTGTQIRQWRKEYDRYVSNFLTYLDELNNSSS